MFAAGRMQHTNWNSAIIDNKEKTKAFKKFCALGELNLTELKTMDVSSSGKYFLAEVRINTDNVVRIFIESEDYFKTSRYFVGWVMNYSAKRCMNCSTSFSAVNRRHHCRSCGDLICKSCFTKKQCPPCNLMDSSQREYFERLRESKLVMGSWGGQDWLSTRTQRFD